MTGAPDVTFEGGYLPVSAELIEGKLNEIWKEATGAPDDLPLVKLCLANMLVVCDAASRIEAEHLAQQLATRHPSRVLMIVVDESLATYSSFVRTACEFNAEVGAYVCWEIVEILSDAPRSIHLGGAVRSLLIDSVPVVTVDLRSFQSTPVFDHDLHEFSDYYFVSADVVPTSTQFKGFMPLGWYNTLPIRELIGQATGFLILEKEVLSVNSVTLYYRDGGERLDPLLAGWFVSRLADEGTLHASSKSVVFEYRGFNSKLEWKKAADDDFGIVEMDLGNGRVLVVNRIPGTDSESPLIVATRGALRLERSSAIPDLVSYVLAVIGDDAEFKEYAQVQSISTRLPIP